MQEASKNASELLQAEEEEKKKAEKRRMKNKKASHLRNGMPSVQLLSTYIYSVCSIESCPFKRYVQYLGRCIDGDKPKRRCLHAHIF